MHHIELNPGARERFRQQAACTRRLLYGAALANHRDRLKLLYGEQTVVLWDECCGRCHHPLD
ncbi:hypothetical protein [Gallaecimonas sp. GXIMD4217]|uniref:hypothetical protein n=1 Tax=Gallaecimonas sp. GXIMD4217 TaxID=3131927 RepID=UPI00311AE58F